MATFAVTFVLNQTKHHRQLGNERRENVLARHGWVFHPVRMAGGTRNGTLQNAHCRRVAVQFFLGQFGQRFGHPDMNPRLRVGDKPISLQASFILDPGDNAPPLQDLSQFFGIPESVKSGDVNATAGQMTSSMVPRRRRGR